MRRAILTIQGILAVAALAVMAGSATLFINFPSISPNGDGVQDEMTVSTNLSAAVDTLFITINDKVSPAVYDTLIFEAPAGAGDHPVVWGGTDWTGAVLPEGEYDLILYESTGGTGESMSRTVIIDLTSPQVSIDRIEPGVFAPGYPDTSASVTVYFLVTGWETGASASMTVRDPSGFSQTGSLDVTGDGEHTGTWKPAEPESGYYLITVSVIDEAGNSDADSGSVYVDSDGPIIEIITDLPSNTQQPPHEVIGRTYDPGNISWLEYSWTGPNMTEGARTVPDSTWLDGDTLYWLVDTPDTANGDAGYSEGSYYLKVFAWDSYNNDSYLETSFRLDRTPPPPPHIADPPARMIQSQLNLFIQYDDDATDSLFVYWQAGAHVDSAGFMTAALIPGDPFVLTLTEGYNEFWAYGQDRAGNLSTVSNTVSTTLDPTTGITYPEVFRGPSTFQVVSAESAYSVTLDIYDMRGERIRRFSVPGPGTSFDIAWDLTNDDGETVKNGPCVVVIVIETASGRTVDKAFIAVVK